MEISFQTLALFQDYFCESGESFAVVSVENNKIFESGETEIKTMKINRAWSVFEWSGVTLMPDPVKLPIKCVWRTQRRNENYIEKGNTYKKLQARGNASDLVSMLQLFPVCN